MVSKSSLSGIVCLGYGYKILGILKKFVSMSKGR